MVRYRGSRAPWNALSTGQSSVEIVDATQPAFGEAAKKALLQVDFKPGKVSGSAVRTKVSLPIVYRMQ